MELARQPLERRRSITNLIRIVSGLAINNVHRAPTSQGKVFARMEHRGGQSRDAAL